MIFIINIMLVQEAFFLLLPIISSFHPNIDKWIRASRLNKPKGVLNYMVKYLSSFDDIVALQKLINLRKNEIEIASIISYNISDLDKKNKIISLMDIEHDYIPSKENCIVCKKNKCVDIDFCEKKKTNWEGI